jgi:hypothetical protein
MEHFKGFSIDRLLQMLNAALTRQNEKAISSRVVDTKMGSGITEHRRRIVSWLFDLNRKFEFDSETVFLSVTIFDRFLALVKAHPKYLNCIGITCLYLAAKAVEEDRVIPDTLTLVRSSECGCSVAEVLRMERCILDKLSWDLRLATPLDFLHIFHALLLTHCPRVLDNTGLSVSQHVSRLTCRLQTCLLDPQLAGFTPSTLALATLSLDLELFIGWQLWLPATVTLQALAQIAGRDLVWCRELLVRCFPGAAIARAALVASSASLTVYPKPAKRKVDDIVTDDFYEGIKRLYSEDASSSQSAPERATMTCAGEMLRCPSSTAVQKHDYITRVNN